LASPLDEIAARYDDEFSRTPVATVLRNMVWTHLARNFNAGDRVLELGCGTGEDALALAHRGVTVTATDASDSMIERARAKAQRVGLEERIEFEPLSMEFAPAMYRGRTFDGVFSNFGAVNCISDYATLAAGLARLMRPGAALIWVVKGRRLQAAETESYGVRLKYPAPEELAAALRPHFTVERIHPLGWALPPSGANGWLNRSPNAIRALSLLERVLHGAAFLVPLATHYVIIARPTRRISAGPAV
jgi:ubiquinone/menaquinone biosynthesis C-methylase UbiE